METTTFSSEGSMLTSHKSTDVIDELIKRFFTFGDGTTTFDIILYAILGLIILIAILLLCICCICVWRYRKRRRRRRHFSEQYDYAVRGDSTEDVPNIYVNYGTQSSTPIQTNRQSTHIISPENFSVSGEYSAVNPMLNVVRDRDDSGIVHSNSELTPPSDDFHVVDGTKVLYTDILTLPLCPPSQKSKENEENVSLESHVNVLKRSQILRVDSDSTQGLCTVGIWQRDDKEQVPILLKKSDRDSQIEFMQEAAILSQLKHINVVTFYGILKDDLCVTIVMEDLPHTLKSYLNNLRSKRGSKVPRGTSKLLLTFSQQVALGMKYISDKGFIHGNLTATNVMVSSENECKITNFSMCHAIDHNRGDQLRHMIGVKWSAPEVVESSRFSVASDVWSFASVLYEIWSLGRDPFEGESNINVMGLIHQGRRLPPPSGCPIAIYEIMIQCWNANSYERPSFSDLVMDLTRPDVVLLHIPQELLDSHSECSMLAQSVSLGKLMYKDLQMAYCAQ